MSECQWNAISSCGTQLDWQGSIAGDISEKQLGGGMATITASGPADAWFGIGLNASRMADKPYALIVSDKGVIEQKLGTCGSEADHCPGTLLSSSVKVVSNSVSGGVRSVVMTRPLQGATPNHYSFGRGLDQIKLIMAVGRTQIFAYH